MFHTLFHCVKPRLSGHSVYHVRSEMGTYQIPFTNATTECATKGMVLATKDQLTIAYTKGYEVCACGWVVDGNAYYPMQSIIQGCGSQGINHCGSCNNCGQDVYCYKNPIGKIYTKKILFEKNRLYLISY